MNRYEALRYAVKAHAGQVDKCGQPYILHPVAVAEAVDRDSNLRERLPRPSPWETLAVVAFLHDVFEDAPSDRWPTESEVNDPFQWFALGAVTRDEAEAYDDYIERVGNNNIASLVKLADLWHNLQPERQACLPAKEQASLEKRYLKARDRIWEALGYEWWPEGEKLMSEGIEIRRTPSIANDQPYLAEGAGVRVVDIVDRVRAGDSALDVAKDFGVRLESVRLLVEVAEVLAPTEAARQLWEAATEHWRVFDDDEDQRPLADRLFDSSVVYPAMGLKGKELYRIGVALGFIDDLDRSEEWSG